MWLPCGQSNKCGKGPKAATIDWGGFELALEALSVVLLGNLTEVLTDGTDNVLSISNPFRQSH